VNRDVACTCDPLQSRRRSKRAANVPGCVASSSNSFAPAAPGAAVAGARSCSSCSWRPAGSSSGRQR
jgi:hypothetical protein